MFKTQNLIKRRDWSSQNIYESFEVNQDEELIDSEQSVSLFHDPFERFKIDPLELGEMNFYGRLFAGYDPSFFSKFEKSKQL